MVDALLGDGAVVDSCHHGIEGLGEVARTQHDVCTCQNTAHGGLGAGVLLGDGAHLHTVGDDDVLIAQLAAQLILQDDGRHGTRDFRTRDVGRCDVCRHNQLTAPLDACFKSHHLAVQHLVPRLLSRGIAIVRVGLGVAMTGKMLDAPRDARRLQALKIVGHHGSRHSRVAAEGTRTDDDVLGIGVHVGHRGEVDVKAIAFQIRTNGVATLVGIARVARTSDGVHRHILLDVEVGVVGNAGRGMMRASCSSVSIFQA